jgi:hypothetical protein
MLNFAPASRCLTDLLGRLNNERRETKTQHLLVVSPGNLFGGLRLSPFDVDLPGGAEAIPILSAKNFHDNLSVDKGSL